MTLCIYLEVITDFKCNLLNFFRNLLEVNKTLKRGFGVHYARNKGFGEDVLHLFGRRAIPRREEHVNSTKYIISDPTSGSNPDLDSRTGCVSVLGISKNLSYRFGSQRIVLNLLFA